MSRQCQKKDRNNILTPATGCKGWTTQNGGIYCCEAKKESSGFWGGLVKVLGGVAAGAAIPAVVG